MVMPRKRRNSKQSPFYAFNDGKVYAANRKARRISAAKRVLVKQNNLTELENEPKIIEGESNDNSDTQSI